MSAELIERFTVAFEGDVRAMKCNPFHVVSDFGKPMTVGIGDAFARADEAEDKIEAALSELEKRNPNGLYVYPDFVRLPIAALLRASAAEGAGE